MAAFSHGIIRQTVLTSLFVRCMEFVLLLRCRRLLFPSPLKMEGRLKWKAADVWRLNWFMLAEYDEEENEVLPCKEDARKVPCGQAVDWSFPSLPPRNTPSYSLESKLGDCKRAAAIRLECCITGYFRLFIIMICCFYLKVSWDLNASQPSVHEKKCQGTLYKRMKKKEMKVCYSTYQVVPCEIKEGDKEWLLSVVYIHPHPTKRYKPGKSLKTSQIHETITRCLLNTNMAYVPVKDKRPFRFEEAWLTKNFQQTSRKLGKKKESLVEAVEEVKKEDTYIGFRPTITDKEKRCLRKEVDIEEVRTALFSMKGLKGSSPDRIQPIFYKQNWQAIEGGMVAQACSLLFENNGSRSRSDRLSVSFAESDGRVLGGGVAGMLRATSPVHGAFAEFKSKNYKKITKQIDVKLCKLFNEDIHTRTYYTQSTTEYGDRRREMMGFEDVKEV
ncbi:hypothetical protein F3Y22_tig00002841pilonHSYRG00002 [Hibiscus syriacus]|uniref:AT-hook motif nuclear-localized protein n=1 Tax=Hibiscus syriacus TaxID=106335 RepID=A0A6A3CNC2_HIBSY|nr:hypothetical protein F3Y22_tig00002841pilonHSYRG00002 [Hibiscus syriacus]